MARTKNPKQFMDMTDRERTELRYKQDFLIMLADMGNFPRSHRITDDPGAPTVSDIGQYIYPEWEHVIDRQIRELAREHHVGVPDFSKLVKNPGRKKNSADDLPYDEFIPVHAVKFGSDGSVSLLTEGAQPNGAGRRQGNPFNTVGAIKAELRRQAPHIAEQYSALWDEFVSVALTRMERQSGQRIGDDLFDDLHAYGMEQVAKHGLPSEAEREEHRRLTGNPRRRRNAAKQYYKVWFSSPQGQTAPVIVDTDKYPRGSTSITEYSRLFPHTEARFMRLLHTGFVHDTWEDAFHDRTDR